MVKHITFFTIWAAVLVFSEAQRRGPPVEVYLIVDQEYLVSFYIVRTMIPEKVPTEDLTWMLASFRLKEEREQSFILIKEMR